MKVFDVLIIGSGIAGVSIGSLLSNYKKVAILEKEKELSYHSTGRSFAFFIESYGNKEIISLTRISKKFFKDNFDFFLKKKGVMFIANKKQQFIAENFFKQHSKNINLEYFNKNKTLEYANCLNDKYVHSAVLDIDASEIDVNALFEFYRKKFQKNKSEILTNFKIDKVQRMNNKWIINDSFACDLIINASGAWADEVAKIFGFKPINVVPKKRTVFVFKPLNLTIDKKWPLIADIEERFYFKEQSNKIYASPADETPTFPHDCYADELDVAIGIDRIQKATNFKFKSIEHKWSGLRTFVKDKSPVIGFENKEKNFFWLVAQGGYGIQTAPALAQVSANIILNEKTSNLIENNELYNISIDRLR